MLSWIIERDVLMWDRDDKSILSRQSYQFMEDCDCLGEIEMIVLDTEILTSDIVGMDFDDFDCPGFGDMVRDVFGGLERMNMLRYKNRKTGAMTNVRRVYWIESADCDTEEVLKGQPFVYLFNHQNQKEAENVMNWVNQCDLTDKKAIRQFAVKHFTLNRSILDYKTALGTLDV